jgi:hypothetical protein
MAMTKKEILEWLNTMSDDTFIGIDDGGLTLAEVDGPAYLEIGGVPEEWDLEQMALRDALEGSGE